MLGQKLHVLAGAHSLQLCDDGQGDLAKEQEACRQKEALFQSVTRELESAQKSESDARQTIQQLEEGAARALEQITDLQKQVEA